MKKIILITGCSSGIGSATVDYAASRGHIVLASAPSEDLLSLIPDTASAKYIIDVTNEQSIADAIALAQQEFGHIDVLVNNAGYCQAGPVELVTAEQVERQFKVNVFGPLAMIRHVAPVMRKNGGGCIVNLSSMLGLLSMPVVGVYAASKHAIEGLSDALRMELSDSSIDVTMIEPGWIKTNLGPVAEQQANYSWRDDPSNPYFERMQRNEGQAKDMSMIEGQAIDVAKKIVTALEAKSPKARYKVTMLATLLPLLRRVLPTSFFDRIISNAAW